MHSNALGMLNNTPFRNATDLAGAAHSSKSKWQTRKCTILAAFNPSRPRELWQRLCHCPCVQRWQTHEDSLAYPREGYEVIAVPDGVEALRYLLTSGARLPDLILLDLVMPRMDGFEFALKVKQRPQFKAIPLVVISRRVGIVDRLKARLCGMRGYLPKPFKQQQILSLVATFVGPARADQSNIQPGQISAR